MTPPRVRQAEVLHSGLDPGMQPRLHSLPGSPSHLLSWERPADINNRKREETDGLPNTLPVAAAIFPGRALFVLAPIYRWIVIVHNLGQQKENTFLKEVDVFVDGVLIHWSPFPPL